MRALLFFVLVFLFSGCNPYAPALPDSVGEKKSGKISELDPRKVDNSQIFVFASSWARRRCGVSLDEADQTAEAAVLKAQTVSCFVWYCSQKGGEPFLVVKSGNALESFNGEICTSGTEKKPTP